MGTVTLNEVVTGILDGDFDDDFRTLYDTIKLRGKQQSRNKASMFPYEAKVVFNSQAHSIEGLTGVVVIPAGGQRTRPLVRMDDNPVNRSRGEANKEYACPARILELVPEKPKARTRKKKS